MPLRLKAAAAIGLSVRPMSSDDDAFVAALYASTRAEELAATGWPAEMQRQFLAQQHQAQDRHYRTAYPDAEWLIIERSGSPVGRLYLLETERELLIIDISLVPEGRGRGWGGALLADVLARADAAAIAVTLSVVRHNPARRLYLRHGFELVEDKGLYLVLERPPAK